MLYYFLKDKNAYSPAEELKNKIRQQIKTLDGIEYFTKYFDDKLKEHHEDIEITCNLRELITDLDYLKLYIVQEK